MKTRGFSQVLDYRPFVVSFFFPFRCFPARVWSGIANGGSAPFWMAPFPPVKAVETDGVADQPNLTGAKVHILAAHHADVFDTIPDVRVRHADRHYRLGRGHIDPCGLERYRAAACQRGHQPEQTYDFAIFHFHISSIILGTERATCSGVKMTERRCGRYGVFPLCLHQGMAGSPGFILAAVPGGRGETVGNRTLRGRSPGSSLLNSTPPT